jgi:hypothetical protein
LISLRFEEFLLAVQILRGVSEKGNVNEDEVQQESTPSFIAGDMFVA